MSSHLIPDDFDFVSTDEPAFVSADEEVRVQAGAEVRMRIVGTRMDATEIVRARAQRTVGLGTLHCLTLAPGRGAVRVGRRAGRRARCFLVGPAQRSVAIL